MKTSTHARFAGRTNRLRPSAWWTEHFKRDKQRDWTIPWQAAVSLTAFERARIAKSIGEFQRGESSEARNYLEKSARFGTQANDPAFHATSELFVASENLHADLLLRFMQQSGIPRRQSSSLDGVFRWLRSLSDLGWCSRVIIIAELVAQEYYPCLRAATTHPVLIRICDRVIAEEASHIQFQVERIARIEAPQPSLMTKVRNVLQRVLMCGTACVVYAGHHRVLGVRLGFGEFLTRVHARNARAISAMVALRNAAIPRMRETTGDWAPAREHPTCS